MIKLSEDLRKWFGKGKTGSTTGGGWDRYNSSGEKVGKCGDSKEGSAYAACLSKEKAAKLGPDGRAAFVKRKRAAQSDAGDSKKGGEQKKGQKPTFVKTGASKNENMKLTTEQKLQLFLEKNCPTDPAKWSASKSAAKSKFDVYPSAYANGWAAKNYKEKGGGWKTCNEGEVNALCEDCWDGYKQVGMKKKGDRQVPNCVPENVIKEGRGVKSIQNDLNKTLLAIEAELVQYKKTKGTSEEKKHIDNLKKLNPLKKKYENELDLAVSGLYKDAELKIED
jgi:hypothetical protein